MGEFEADSKELEADSWSITADKKYLKQLKQDNIKKQDVIYGWFIFKKSYGVQLTHLTSPTLELQ